jgi:hypothetical protein
MPRTDATQVGAVIDVDDGDVLDPFINAANELVTEACASKKGADGVTPYYADARLTMIETWLAAHFYAVWKPRKSSLAPTGLSISYQSSVGLGFDVTHYGQHAMRLDTKGGLASINERTKKGGGKVGAFWLGTDYHDPNWDGLGS